MWFTADLHLFHKNIINYCGRPFGSTHQMHKTLIENFNAFVTYDDDLWILGDVAFIGNSNWETLRDLLKKFNGRKHLVLGNHDCLKPFKYMEIGFDTVHTMVQVEEFWLVHDPALAIPLEDEHVLCGHVHHLFTKARNVLNVGVDVWDYEPVHIEVIREQFR